MALITKQCQNSVKTFELQRYVCISVVSLKIHCGGLFMNPTVFSEVSSLSVASILFNIAEGYNFDPPLMTQQ